MMRAISRVVACGLGVCLMAAVSLAQTTTTSDTKKFQVISVTGNQLVVRLPEGTRELTVPDDFRFNVDGKMLSVHELKAGMSGSATITTKTTVTPVTVTEVKNGTVMQASGASVIVRTDEGIKMFTQGDLDKRGIKVMKDGKVAELSDLHANDKLTAVFITSKPPRVVTEKEVAATLAQSGGGAAGAGAGAGAGGGAAANPLVRPRRRQRRPQRLPQEPLALLVALRLGSCPKPRLRCLFSASSESRRSLRGWA